MSFLAIKNNPFDAYGEQWAGAEKRAEEVTPIAAAAATEVLAETVQKRARSFDRFDEDLISKVGVLRGNDFEVGLIGASEDEEQRAMLAEYGDGEAKPQPLMRTSETRALPEAQEVFHDILSAALWGSE